jgi:hypothetical protein
VSFLGNCTRVAVTCPGLSAPVTAEVHGAAAIQLLELVPGQAVELFWNRESAVRIEDAPPTQAATPAATEEVPACNKE